MPRPKDSRPDHGFHGNKSRLFLIGSVRHSKTLGQADEFEPSTLALRGTRNDRNKRK